MAGPEICALKRKELPSTASPTKNPMTASSNYPPQADPELMRLREQNLPLNGETPFCDAAAAFASAFAA